MLRVMRTRGGAGAWAAGRRMASSAAHPSAAVCVIGNEVLTGKVHPYLCACEDIYGC